jgi:hypothetical protein
LHEASSRSRARAACAVVANTHASGWTARRAA